MLDFGLENYQEDISMEDLLASKLDLSIATAELMVAYRDLHECRKDLKNYFEILNSLKVHSSQECKEFAAELLGSDVVSIESYLASLEADAAAPAQPAANATKDAADNAGLGDLIAKKKNDKAAATDAKQAAPAAEAKKSNEAYGQVLRKTHHVGGHKLSYYVDPAKLAGYQDAVRENKVIQLVQKVTKPMSVDFESAANYAEKLFDFQQDVIKKFREAESSNNASFADFLATLAKWATKDLNAIYDYIAWVENGERSTAGDDYEAEMRRRWG